MIRKAALAALAWVLLSAFTAPFPEGFAKAGDSIIHEPSGFIFPPSLFDYNSTDNINTLDASAVKEASVGYNYYAPMRKDAPDIAATIYIYATRSEKDSSNLKTKINSENALSMRDISAEYPNDLRDILSQPVKGKCGAKDILGAYNSFNIGFSNTSNQSETLRGEVYIFVQADWVIKFKFIRNQKATDSTLEFVKSFFKANENHASCI